jgi:Cu2+-exporting ATPase
MFLEITLLGLAYYGSKTIKEEGRFTQKVMALSDKVKKHFQDAPAPRIEAASDTQPQAGAQQRNLEELHSHYKDISIFSVGALTLKNLVPAAGPLGFAAYVYGLAPQLRSVEQSLRTTRRVNVDSLFLFADILALLTGSYIAASFSLYLIQTGKLGIVRAKGRSLQHIQHLFRDLPSNVWVMRDGVEMEVPLKTIQRDDIVVLHAGKVIPVDGVITKGFAGIDQQALTGEAQVAEKGPGDRVFANTILLNGRILVKVEQSGPETTANQIAEILVNSINYKSKSQLRGEKWADQLINPMFFSSLVLLPVIGPVSTSVFINAHIGMRIRILAPMGTLKHIGMASKKGLLVKDGRALEKFLDVDTILFDKTGTLTHEEPEVTGIISTGVLDAREIIRHAAIAEQKLTHPIARAILNKALEMDVSFPEIDDSRYAIGYGIKVDSGGETIQAGSLRYLDGENIFVSEELRRLQDSEQLSGRSYVFLAVNREVVGALQLQPRARRDIADVIAKLREQGIRYMAIVSGDTDIPTRLLAEKLGMDGYFANVLPQQKADIVATLQAEGKTVCFIGDGINDSIALKQADVSISLAGANTIAKDMAEIVLMEGHIGAVNDLHDISRALDKNLKRSLKLSIAPGAINLLGAFVLHFNTLASLLVNASFAMVGARHVRPEADAGGPEPEPAEGGGKKTREVVIPIADPRHQGPADRRPHDADPK